MRDFTASLASRLFTPVSSTLKKLAASLPATKRTSSTSMQQIDTAVFGDVFQRCSTFMKACETPAFLAAGRLIDLQQPKITKAAALQSSERCEKSRKLHTTV